MDAEGSEPVVGDDGGGARGAGGLVDSEERCLRRSWPRCGKQLGMEPKVTRLSPGVPGFSLMMKKKRRRASV